MGRPGANLTVALSPEQLNRASRAVAERLGFARRVRRESHWITDRFVDHVVYGRLDRE